MADTRRTALVLGGVRSGKSRFAQDLAAARGAPVLFVATGHAADPEMEARIAAHRAARPSSWETLESSEGLGSAILGLECRPRTILVDCLTMVVSARLMACAEEDVLRPETTATLSTQLDGEVDELVAAATAIQAHLIVVSSEVGLGVVPPYPMGRSFRDLLGIANQRLARVADQVFLMVAGIAVDVKKLAQS